MKGDFMTYIWVFSSLLLIFIIWSLIEEKLIFTSRYNIESQLLLDNQNGLSFVVLADLHNKRFGKNNKVLVKKILEEKPDFIIIAGDLITKRKPCYPGNAYGLIKELSEHYPVYYALGNHEQSFEDLVSTNDSVENNEYLALYESWKLYKEKLEQLGVYILDNKSIEIKYKDRKITITGLSLSVDFYNKGKPLKLEEEYILSHIGKRSSDAYQILIAHNPVYFKEYVQWGADLILSGHVHGGMIRIPFIGGLISPQVRLFPKYDGGQFSQGDRHMIVSRGLGSHSFMPRFFNPPDLVLIKLKNN